MKHHARKCCKPLVQNRSSHLSYVPPLQYHLLPQQAHCQDQGLSSLQYSATVQTFPAYHHFPGQGKKANCGKEYQGSSIAVTWRLFLCFDMFYQELSYFRSFLMRQDKDFLQACLFYPQVLHICLSQTLFLHDNPCLLLIVFVHSFLGNHRKRSEQRSLCRHTAQTR